MMGLRTAVKRKGSGCMNLRHYLAEYELSHQHPMNVRIHSVCVPLIAWTSLGFTHSFSLGGIPVSYIGACLTLVLYALFRNLKIELAMAICLAFFILSYRYIPHLRNVSVILFIAGWVGQLIGHKLEAKKPSFTQDLVFFLIGPIWTIQKVFGLKL